MATHTSQNHTETPNETQITGVWLSFVEAADINNFCRNWLFLQCHMIDEVQSGMVLLGEPGTGPYAPVAVWPDLSQDLQHLVHAAESALAKRQGVVSLDSRPETPGLKQYHIAYPLDISGKLYGVVVLEVSDRQEEALRAALRQLHWGMAWLETIFRRQGEEQDRQMIQRLSGVLELAATAVQPGAFPKIAMALVNELASRLHCQRVSLGHYKNDFVHLVAISHTAQFDKKTNLAQALESAMEEALDQQGPVLYPPEEAGTTVTRLHEELAQRFGSAIVHTVPLPGREQMFGALTLERQSGPVFTVEEQQLCEAMAHLLGPVLETQQQNEQWIGARMYQGLHRQLEKFLGPGNIVLKSLAALICLLILLVCVIRVEYRVTAKTVLEGSVQRVISAPFDGYLMLADKRAGDTIAAGEILCRLDDRDLQLEQLKWRSEAEQFKRKYQESLANHDRAEARIAEAQINQAKAEMALLDEKLAKAKVTAPFAGVLVSGDLSQKLGTPVRQGDELFKLAPMEQYRVILQVDEREIAQISNGSNGTLILSGLTHAKLPFVLKRITPVTTTEGGRNYFRVEAGLLEHPEHLRPGMEGIGKIESGKRSLIWIWTHSMVNWFRLWIWSWWL